MSSKISIVCVSGTREKLQIYAKVGLLGGGSDSAFPLLSSPDASGD